MATETREELKRLELELLERKRELLNEQKKQLAREASLFEKGQNTPSVAYGVSDALLGGLTLRAADPIRAFGSAALNSMSSDKSFSDLYDEAIFDLELKKNRFRRDHPALAFASEATGGIATGLAGGGKVLAAKALENVPTAFKIAGAGAAEGGAYGFFDAPPGQRAEGAAIGAAGGAVFAPAGAAGLSVAGPVVRSVGQRVWDSLTDTPKNKAIKIVLKALEADDITPDEAAARLREMGADATLADLGPNMSDLARQGTATFGSANKRASTFLLDRQRRQGQNIKSAASKLLGADDFDVDVINTLQNRYKTRADPYYRAAASKPISMTPELTAIVNSNSPAIRAAVRDAQAAVDLMRSSGKTPSHYQFFDQLKKSLDDQISEAIRSGKKTLAANLTQTKNRMLGIIDEQIPEYKIARGIWAGEAGIRDASSMGRSILTNPRKIDLEELSESVAKLNESELQAFRHGVLRSLVDDIDMTRETRNAAAKYAQTPKLRAILRLAFPDDAAFDAFIKSVDAQDAFTSTKNRVLGNSITFRAQRQGRQLSDEFGLMGSMAGNAPTQIAANIANAIMRDDLPPEVLNKAAEILLDPSIIPQRVRPHPVNQLPQYLTPKLTAPQYAGAVGGAVAPWAVPAGQSTLSLITQLQNQPPR